MVPQNSLPPFNSRKSAFSLVEVAIALGIVAFAFTTLLGLLPVGLGLFRSATDTWVSTRIVQKISGDLQQADFDSVASANGGILYFDEQGNALTSAAKAIYWVKINVFTGATLPGSGNIGNSSNSNIARIVIQVAYNPGSKSPVAVADGTWPEQDGIRLIKRSLYLARNTPQTGA